MNLITGQIVQNFTNWIDAVSTPQIIDTVTYNVYDENNPFRVKFSSEDIHNKTFRMGANAAAAMGAETFSFFTNPYYLTHKIINAPQVYQSTIDAYKKYSANK